MDGKQEAKRRIEVAFAAGEATQRYCQACGSAECDTYRPAEDPESEVLIYCPECAAELSEHIIPSEEFHNDE